jgi:RsiW-degrading membrane proteinase PrsW (M82 family)
MLFVFGWHEFENPNLLPGLIISGSFAVPFATLIFFFETNSPRNVSMIRVIQLLFIGGIMSLLLSLLLFEVTPFLGAFGAPAAGIVEESGKLAAVLIGLRFIPIGRYPYRLNALLFGAAVGTGFAAFESAGYALVGGLAAGDDVMLETITLRGVLAPFSHIVWTAIATSAYWKCRKYHSDIWTTLSDTRFLMLFAAPVAMHTVWNMDFTGPFHVKYAVLGFVAWVIIISLIQTGLKEVKIAAEVDGASNEQKPAPKAKKAAASSRAK